MDIKMILSSKCRLQNYKDIHQNSNSDEDDNNKNAIEPDDPKPEYENVGKLIVEELESIG